MRKHYVYPIEFVLREYFKQPPNKAKTIAAVAQVVAMVLLLIALLLFVEWRFIAFETHGCAAYCKAITQQVWENATYVLP